MKSLKKVALAAAVACVAAGNAFAAADLDTPAATTGGVYAAERNITVATGLASGAAADQTATASFGASFATDAVAYVRFDLPNGVTFTANPAYSVNDSAAAPAVVSIAQGGAGQKFVVFAVAPSAVGENLVGANLGTLVAAGVTTANKNAISLQYQLFETLTNAANNTLPLKSTTHAAFISFANAITVTPATALTAVADVSATTGAYTKFTGPSTEKPVVSFTVTHTVRALTTGAASTVGAILADTNAVSVTGNFAAADAATVTLDSSSTCANAGTAGTLAGDKQSVSFSGITAANIVANQWYVCYEVNTTVAIAESSYTGTVDLVGQTNYTAADGATGNGSISRNGTVLKAAFADAGVSGFGNSIHLTNTGTNAAAYTTSCLTEAGRVAGLAGSVPANSGVRRGVNSGSGLGCPANTRGVELTMAVPSGSVIGSIVRQNVTTGQAGFDGMVGNQ